MSQLPTDILAGDPDHVANHNQAHGMLNDVGLNVKAVPYNAAVDGATNDTAAGNAAIDAAAAAGGGIVYIPAGTMRANLTLKPRVRLIGAGTAVTTIKAVAGSNADVIRGFNYDTLTGKAYAVGDGLRGAYDCEIRDLTIDGDKATMTTGGCGVRLWGKGVRFSNLTVQNCVGAGLSTEFTTHDAGAVGEDPRGTFTNIISQSNDSNGWTFRGPHDSKIQNFVTYSNAGWGFYSDVSTGSWNGGVGGSEWNSWLNGAGSFFFDRTLTELSDSIASGPGSGDGIVISAASGSAKMTNIEIAGHFIGLSLAGILHTFSGKIQNCTGAAVQMTSTQNCVITATGLGNALAVSLITPAGGDVIDGTFSQAAGTVLLSGTPHSTGLVRLTQIGALGNLVKTWLGDVVVMKGAGTPEGAITAPIGSTYHRTDGGAGTSFYVKESGTGNTGWAAK